MCIAMATDHVTVDGAFLSVPCADILQLLQLVFTVLTTSMQDDPANRLFFETNVCQFVCYPLPL